MSRVRTSRVLDSGPINDNAKAKIQDLSRSRFRCSRDETTGYVTHISRIPVNRTPLSRTSHANNRDMLRSLFGSLGYNVKAKIQGISW